MVDLARPYPTEGESVYIPPDSFTITRGPPHNAELTLEPFTDGGVRGQQAADRAAMAAINAWDAINASLNPNWPLSVQTPLEENRTAIGRATRLLYENLNPEQWYTWRKHGAFSVRGSEGGLYWVNSDHNYNSTLIEIGSYNPFGETNILLKLGTRLCVEISSSYGLPLEDRMLALKLFIECNEKQFLDTANVTVANVYLEEPSDISASASEPDSTTSSFTDYLASIPEADGWINNVNLRTPHHPDYLNSMTGSYAMVDVGENQEMVRAINANRAPTHPTDIRVERDSNNVLVASYVSGDICFASGTCITADNVPAFPLLNIPVEVGDWIYFNPRTLLWTTLIGIRPNGIVHRLNFSGGATLEVLGKVISLPNDLYFVQVPTQELIERENAGNFPTSLPTHPNCR